MIVSVWMLVIALFIWYWIYQLKKFEPYDAKYSGSEEADAYHQLKDETQEEKALKNRKGQILSRAY